MPWSAKAQELLRAQYAAVGAAGSAALPQSVRALQQATNRLAGDSQSTAQELLASFTSRAQSIDKFIAAYRQYCWSVDSLADLKLAPFHLLATEGKVHTDQNHVWHMESLAKICAADTELLLPTNYRVIDVNDAASTAAGIDWWLSLTGQGGEGMVVKPLDWIVRGKKGLVQRL